MVVLSLSRLNLLPLRVAGLTIAALSISLVTPNQLQAGDQPSDGPTYTADGSLVSPKDFDTWVFVGSNLGLSYKPEAIAMTAREATRANPQQFHNIYINKTAYDSFLHNKTFPDKTILVMEIFAASNMDSAGILSSGAFNGPRSGLEVAVKNLSRPDGSKTPWAYYSFTDEADPSKINNTAVAFPDTACETCHHLHAKTDNVWVQFYPRLRAAL